MVSERVKSMFKEMGNNYAVFLVALAVGIVFGLPHILIPLLQGGATQYTPLVVSGVAMYTVDETYYAAYISEVYNGNLVPSDPSIFEYKNTPLSLITTPIFPSMVLGYLTHLTGSVPRTVIFGDFVLPMIIFLLVYFFLLKLTSEKYISILGGVALLLGLDLFAYSPINMRALIILFDRIVNPNPISPLNYFARLPAIQFNFIPLIAAIIFLYLSIKEEKKIYSISAGICAGLLFYTYVYYWTFFFAGSGFLFLAFLFKKDYRNLKQVLITVLVGGIISIPYWISFINAPPYYSSDLLYRAGIRIGRRSTIQLGHGGHAGLSWLVSAKYLLFLSIFLIFIKKKKEEFYLLTAFLLGGIALFNMQVVTGYTVQPGHWITTAINPLMIVMLFYLIFQTLNATFKKYYKLLCVISILFFLVYGINYQANYSINTYKYFTLPRTTIEALSWLNENTELDDVVLSNSIENIFLIPAYTHNNNFIPNAHTLVVPTQEIVERWYIAYKLFSVSPSYLEELMNTNDAIMDLYYISFEITKTPNKKIFEEAFWSTTTFQLKYYYSLDRDDSPEEIKEALALRGGMYYIPLEVRRRMLNEYLNYTDNANELLSKYRVDYVYYGPYERRIANIAPSSYSQLKEVWKNEDVIIYKVIR